MPPWLGVQAFYLLRATTAEAMKRYNTTELAVS
jgi:hypothetical protein